MWQEERHLRRKNMDFVEATDTSINYNCPAVDGQICDLDFLKDVVLLEDRRLDTIWRQIRRSKNKFDQTRLLAEKLVLVSALKTKLFNNNFRQVPQTTENQMYNIGFVTISNVVLRCIISKKVKQYFLCAVITNSTLYVSQICSPDSNGIVNFIIDQTFSRVSTDFQIRIKIFNLEVKKKDIKNKISKLSCWIGIDRNSSLWRRESLFKLVEEKTISFADRNHKKEIFLGKINTKEYITSIDLCGKPDVSELFLVGWLDVSKDGLFWYQRWCVLQEGILKCFIHPADPHPLKIIYLDSCTSARIAGKNEVLRNKALILEVASQSQCQFSFYLSTDVQEEWNQWKVLAQLITTLRFWLDGDCYIV